MSICSISWVGKMFCQILFGFIFGQKKMLEVWYNNKKMKI